MAFLKNHTDLYSAGGKVLHIAPEAPIADNLCKLQNVEYVAGDLQVRPGIIYVDLENIQFGDGTFDVILCNHVLEHILDDRKAYKEMFRILRPGGWALITLPTYGEKTWEDASLDEAGREHMYGIADHVRLNGLDVKEKIREAGFEVDVYSIDSIAGNYVDRSMDCPAIESNKYLFLARK